jgi:hypothetical protein
VRVKSRSDRPFPTGQCLKTTTRCRRCPRLTSRMPVSTVPSLGSEADHIAVRVLCLCPSAPPPLSSRLRRREPLHGERSPEHPLAAFFSGIHLHLSFLSLPTPTQDPAGHRSPTSLENTVAVPVFPPLPSARSSGELLPPPTCPAGGLSVVDARAPHTVQLGHDRD